jgi:hypothetical protein
MDRRRQHGSANRETPARRRLSVDGKLRFTLGANRRDGSRFVTATIRNGTIAGEQLAARPQLVCEETAQRRALGSPVGGGA